jgi:hypothetical protein
VDNLSIRDKHWLCAEPLVYWPIVTRFYASQFNLRILIAIGRKNSYKATHLVGLVNAYVFDGHWYDRAGLEALIRQGAIIHAKISFVLTLRYFPSKDPPIRRCIVRHELVHPYFENALGVQFESFGQQTMKRSLYMLTQFMNRQDCGPDRNSNYRLHDECLGVLAASSPISCQLSQNDTFPLIVSPEVIKPALEFLADCESADATKGTLKWTFDKWHQELTEIEQHTRDVINGRTVNSVSGLWEEPTDATRFWPGYPVGKLTPMNAISQAIANGEDASHVVPLEAKLEDTPASSTHSSPKDTPTKKIKLKSNKKKSHSTRHT